MVLLLLIFLLVGIIVATVIFYQKAQATEHRQLAFQAAGDFKPVAELGDSLPVTKLKIGDIVIWFDQDFVVEGQIDYNDDGWPWTCFMLVDGNDIRWLAIEEDDQLEVSIWKAIDMHLDQVPEFIEHQGEVFTMVESGSARVSQLGQTGRRRAQTMEYYSFEGTSDRMLSIEKWGREIEVSIGEEINPYSLEILPGAGTSIT